MATKKRVTKNYKKASLKEIASDPNDVGIPADWEGWKKHPLLDDEPGIDVPFHLRGGDWKWNFEKKPMSLADKITWVLTVVNVAILISLVIKNV